LLLPLDVGGSGGGGGALTADVRPWGMGGSGGGGGGARGGATGAAATATSEMEYSLRESSHWTAVVRVVNGATEAWASCLRSS
jgi:hypothetical protein